MSHASRIARFAERVAGARRPKRLRAAKRLSELPTAAEPATEALQDLPAVIPKFDSQQASQQLAPSLPLSGEATRWLTRGEVPTDLVPLLGDPAFPDRPVSPEEPQSALPPWLAAELEQGPREGGPGAPQVIARIVEGAPMPAAATPSETPNEDRALHSWDRAEVPSPPASIEELPGAHRETPPLLRLARSPSQQRPHAPEQPGPAAAPPPNPTRPRAAPSLPARELARRSGGELKEDGMGGGSVTFRRPAAPSAGAPASSARTPAKTADVGLASAIPISPALRRQLGDLDVDELYEAFLHRLRRDLLHDRERLGDLLGPLR